MARTAQAAIPRHDPADPAPWPPVLERGWATTLPELSRPAAPVRTPRPELLALNEELAAEIGLDADRLRTDAGIRFLTGELHPPETPPVAQVYAGHQWGTFRPILGDGRAALLGEVRDREGRLRDVHLKGIGPTPMSRVDGFAVVGPMLRELLLSEAMHALGVPTTRALAVVATGAPRELDGTVLPGAVLTRTAASHIRFGSFEYAAASDDPALLRRLADHAIARHHPDAAETARPYHSLLQGIVDATAATTAAWMRLGFVHGVLSTDNVLVSGETIDYGPCAFLDAYDPEASFSTLDVHGRYAFARQPSIMRWNLDRLGESFAPLLGSDASVGREAAAEIVAGFDAGYAAHRGRGAQESLGLGDRIDAGTAAALDDEILELLRVHGVDLTGFRRDLAAAADGDERRVRERFLGEVPALDAWLASWSQLHPDAAAIRRTAPLYIPRNHLVEEALAAATDGDLAPFSQLRDLVRTPFVEREGTQFRRYARPGPASAAPYRTFCGT